MPPALMGPFRCVNVPDSRPSQTARRTGTPALVLPARSKTWATRLLKPVLIRDDLRRGLKPRPFLKQDRIVSFFADCYAVG
jgi:hypothetical protein